MAAQMPVKMKLLRPHLLILVIVALGVVRKGESQGTTATRLMADDSYSAFPTSRTTFRVGCVRYDPDTRISTELAEQLVASLNANERVRTAMAVQGFSEIQVQSFDAHRWLMEAMDAEQLDLVFCSSIDYVEQSYQRGTYMPLFQLRLPNDVPARDRLYYYGSIFVNNRSELFGLSKEDAQAKLRDYLGRHQVALVGASSAVGYIYPVLKLHELTSSTAFLHNTQFWGSSEEVAKAVINGAAEIGACDQGAIQEVLRRAGLLESRSRILREISPTKPLPRDPVVIRAALRTTALGRAVREGMRKFFLLLRPPLPRLETSEEMQQFKELQGAIGEFQALRRAEDTGPHSF